MTQFHQEQKDKDALASLLAASGGSMTLMPYDGAAEFYAESAEKFTKFFLEVYASPHIVGTYAIVLIGRWITDDVKVAASVLSTWSKATTSWWDVTTSSSALAFLVFLESVATASWPATRG